MKTKNILITGIPRSGTSLLTSTIHQLPNCVAFSEPVELKLLMKISASREEYCQRLLDLISTMRSQIQAGSPVANRFRKNDSEVASNYYQRVKTANGYKIQRTNEIREEVVSVENEDFVLCLKNNERLTCCLEVFAELPEVQIVAMVRDPVACILSWRSLNIDVSRGRLKAGERFAPELKKIKKLDDLLLRQVKILDWFCSVYYHNCDKLKLLRYEDFVERPELLTDIIDLPKGHVFPKRHSMNNRWEYNHDEAGKIRQYIGQNTQFVRFFYPNISCR